MSRVTIMMPGGGTSLTRVVCDALVDQGRTINGDPVGYRCMEAATHHLAFTLEDGETATEEIADLCPRCHAMVREEPGRVTLTPARERRVPWGMLVPPRAYTEAEVRAAARGAGQAAAGHAVRACAAWLLLHPRVVEGKYITVESGEGYRELMEILAGEMRLEMGAEVERAYKEDL
jgi:hypothetical protein